jgi:type II secretory pathway component PulM
VLSRIGHTLCYLWPRQPLRNRMYLLGQGVMIVLIGLMLGAMFRS